MVARFAGRGRLGGEGSGEAPALAVRGARRAYGARDALAGVDLTLQPGELFSLLGPNGAGKTSLVRAISGRLRLDAGTVRLCGEDPAADPGARRLLGLVPQELALYPDLSAAENLQIFAGLMGLGRREARLSTQRLLEKVGLADRAGERVETLSGGMKRRLNVAAGVIHRPRVLLLDEPTVGVDPAAREDVHELLRELRSDGLAILLTTHDLEQAEELADRVGILIDGRMRAEGTVPELVGRVFGSGKELLVSLAAAPEEPGQRHMEELEMTPSRDRRVWTKRLDGGLDDLSALGPALGRAGLEVEEVRVREPSLRGVFFNLAGREIDA